MQQNLMMSSKEDMREYAAQLYALVVVSGETSERQLEIVREFTSNVKSQVYDKETNLAKTEIYFEMGIFLRSRKQLYVHLDNYKLFFDRH